MGSVEFRLHEETWRIFKKAMLELKNILNKHLE